MDDDPVKAWASARGAVQEVLDDPEAAAQEFEGYMGKTTFQESVDRFMGVDLVVHAWDLARATGGDEKLDANEVHSMFEQVKPMDEMLRSPDVCGPKVEVSADADEQTKFLAFMGRKP